MGASEGAYGLLDALGGSPDGLAGLVGRAEKRVDVSGFGLDELREALLAEVENVGQDVWLAWPADGTTARAAYQAVLARLGDLWRPNQDDLVIIDHGERVIVLDREERLSITRADARLLIHSVEVEVTTATCVARCVGGVVRIGQRFGVGLDDRTRDDAPLVTLEGILRYGRPVDFVDPPHSALVRLTGDAVVMMAPGHIVTAVAGR
ncbi:hypothetical protein ACWDE9_09865 [Streptomyces olivaceoviridis]